MTCDERLDAGEPRGFQDILVRGICSAERNVVAKLAVEQIRILQNKADAGPQISGVLLPNVDPIDQDAALARRIKGGREATDRRLA